MLGEGSIRAVQPTVAHFPNIILIAAHVFTYNLQNNANYHELHVNSYVVFKAPEGKSLKIVFHHHGLQSISQMSYVKC